MGPAKLVSLLSVWGLALLGSGLLVLAGAHWPEPPPLSPPLVWSMVLAPPALVGLWLASRWSRPSGAVAREGRESTPRLREQG
jgi:hypothetical protein